MIVASMWMSESDNRCLRQVGQILLPDLTVCFFFSFISHLISISQSAMPSPTLIS